MDKQTEKLLADIYAARELEAKPLLTEKDIYVQIKAMRTPGGFNTRKAIDYMTRRLAPTTNTPRNVARGFPREWAAEFDASVRGLAHFRLADIADARALALVLESCRGPKDVLGHTADFRGKEHLEPIIIYWTVVKHTNMRFLYEDFPKDRSDFFASQDFRLVVFGLCNGFYEGCSINAAGELQRPDKRTLPDPESALTGFIADDEPAAMAAKSRD